MQVDLVSFDPGEPGGPSVPKSENEPALSSPSPSESPLETAVSTAVEPAQPPASKEPEPVREIKPDVSLKSKPKNLEELMAQMTDPKPRARAKTRTRACPKTRARAQTQTKG